MKFSRIKIIILLSLSLITLFVFIFPVLDKIKNLKSALIIEEDKPLEREIEYVEKVEYERIKKQLAEVTRGSMDRMDLIKFKKYEKLKFLNLNEFKSNEDSISINIQKFLLPQLTVGKHVLARGTGYLDIFDNNLIIITGNGFLAHIELSDLENLEQQNDRILVSMNIIDTNIFEHITYDQFYLNGRFGVKDLLVHNNKLYISYSNKEIDGGYGFQHLDCFNTGILVAELNFKKINFEEFYKPKKCVKIGNEYGRFNAHHAGGRMIVAKNKIIFTQGEYKYRDLAQDDNVELGKIVELNFDGTLNRIISKGHRNPQGLYFDYDKEIIFSTEHGAMGGDEINIVRLDKNEVSNYGWPVASYGKFYPDDIGPFNQDFLPSEIVKYLHPKKKHSEFGFIEPLKFYNPSIGVSQIIGNLNFPTNKNSFYLVGSMGDINVDYQSSLYLYELNENNKIINEYKLKLDERIRDIVRYKEKYYLFFENSPSIGVITFN